jgi:hypothetical protein
MDDKEIVATAFIINKLPLLKNSKLRSLYNFNATGGGYISLHGIVNVLDRPSIN